MGLFKTYSEKEVKRVRPIVEKINSLESEIQKLSDEELRNKTAEFKDRLTQGETLDDILPEAFAVVREASKRVLGMRHFDVQLIGGIILHQGRIAEMKTGEGKTLVATLPVYLNALTGKGVHVVTVNDYLAKRDSEWMGKVYKFLGLTVGLVISGMDPSAKKAAYAADVTYGTNNEFGFDYLRDNMVIYKDQLVQRELNYAIVDEIDSILIDEARTPLIISGRGKQSSDLYKKADKFVRKLIPKVIVEEDAKNFVQAEDNENYDYIVDLKAKSASLTQKGIKKAEEEFGLENFNDIENSEIVHNVNQALRAHGVMKKDIDYIVKDGEVLIVDEFTGRIMYGRRYNNGLHQAIEAKEGVQIQQETKTLATITFQNLFRMYKKLSGMTGTAKTEEEEFRNIYNMFVIQIPTNKEVIRDDEPDLVYSTKSGKYKALINEIEARYQKGQPVLVGTIAIETNELISSMLRKKKIPHEVLNAKNHAREAEIIAKAGEAKSVTIATNMAGRGTDIKLGEGVKELGGLCVLGTERHESRRIDNQLRGRSGRQGDPGFTQFYVSMEDDLMVRFGTDRVKGMLQSLGFDEDQPIKSKMFTNAIATAQSRVEGNNFDIRKQLLQYDDVMNNQREIMYGKRNEILDNESIHDAVLNSIHEHVTDLVQAHTFPEGHLNETDVEEIVEYANENLFKKTLNINDVNKNVDDLIETIYTIIVEEYEEKIKGLPKEVTDEFEKVIVLNIIDRYWTEHINTMSHLREGIGLRGYAQDDPLRAYTMEGFDLFDKMMQNIDKDVTILLIKAEITQNIERKEVSKKQITNDGKDHIKQVPKKVQKIGRNDPCPCGSGKKYKQCCGK